MSSVFQTEVCTVPQMYQKHMTSLHVAGLYAAEQPIFLARIYAAVLPMLRGLTSHRWLAQIFFCLPVNPHDVCA